MLRHQAKCAFDVLLFVTVAIAALVVAGAPRLGSIAMAQEPSPTFWVSQDFNNIFGGGWPAGVDVTVTADDPETVEAPDLTVAFTTNAEGNFPGLEAFPGLQPGWFITVTDGEVTKTHTVGNVFVTVIDPNNDTLAGTADPGTEVYAGGVEGPELGKWPVQHGIWTEADSSGAWRVDVTGEYDITAWSVVGAQQMDEDGDFTYTLRVDKPVFWVGLDCDCFDIAGGGWPAEVDLMVTADDPETVAAPDIAVTLTTNAEGSFEGPQVFPGLQPGWFITVTDGEGTKTHTVRDISITYVAPATNTMRGTADPGTEVYAGGVGYKAGHYTNANDSGEWSVDVSDVYDITPGSKVAVNQTDEDGDFTYTLRVVPMTLDELLDNMVADGHVPNEGVANSIMKQAERASLGAVTNHLNDLVRRGRITQQTMDQLLAMVAA